MPKIKCPICGKAYLLWRGGTYYPSIYICIYCNNTFQSIQKDNPYYCPGKLKIIKKNK